MELLQGVVEITVYVARPVAWESAVVDEGNKVVFDLTVR